MIQLAVLTNNTDNYQPGICVCVGACAQATLCTTPLFGGVYLLRAQNLHEGSQLHAPHRAISLSVKPRTHCTIFYLYLHYEGVGWSSQPGPKLEGKQGGGFLTSDSFALHAQPSRALRNSVF